MTIPILTIDAATYIREKGLGGKVDFKGVYLWVYSSKLENFPQTTPSNSFKKQIPENAMAVIDYDFDVSSIDTENGGDSRCQGIWFFKEKGTAIVPLISDLEEALGERK